MEALPFNDFSISSLPAILTSWRAPTVESITIYFGFLLFLGIGSHIIPGRVVQGQPLIYDPTKRLSYKTNGLSLFFALCAFYFIGGVQLRWFQPTIVYDHFGPIFTTVNIFATALTVILFFTGLISGNGKRHGNLLHDLFLGVELNPRFAGLDLKFFSLRPALMGWIMVNFSLAAQQIKVDGSISTSMLLYQIFSFIYAFDYFFFEEYMLSTWDIIAENWGWMLIWGDYVWISFAFAVQPWFLLYNRFDLTPLQMAVISFIFIVGFYVFRASNAQKHQFKTNPKALIWGKKPETIHGKLLVSGFWGILRKPNYLGDWIVAFSFSFPCLFSTPLLVDSVSTESMLDSPKKEKPFQDVLVPVTIPDSNGSLSTVLENIPLKRWRKGPEGPATLCNACGLAYAKKLKTDQTKMKNMQLFGGAPMIPDKVPSMDNAIQFTSCSTSDFTNDNEYNMDRAMLITTTDQPHISQSKNELAASTKSLRPSPATKPSNSNSNGGTLGSNSSNTITKSSKMSTSNGPTRKKGSKKSQQSHRHHQQQFQQQMTQNVPSLPLDYSTPNSDTPMSTPIMCTPINTPMNTPILQTPSPLFTGMVFEDINGTSNFNSSSSDSSRDSSPIDPSSYLSQSVPTIHMPNNLKVDPDGSSYDYSIIYHSHGMENVGQCPTSNDNYYNIMDTNTSPLLANIKNVNQHHNDVQHHPISTTPTSHLSAEFDLHLHTSSSPIDDTSDLSIYSQPSQSSLASSTNELLPTKSQNGSFTVTTPPQHFGFTGYLDCANDNTYQHLHHLHQIPQSSPLGIGNNNTFSNTLVDIQSNNVPSITGIDGNLSYPYADCENIEYMMSSPISTSPMN
eukprot:gene13334-15681_t